MIEFVVLRAKAHAYLMDEDSEHKKAKGTKTFVIKWRLIFESYIDFLSNNKIILRSKKI